MSKMLKGLFFRSITIVIGLMIGSIVFVALLFSGTILRTVTNPGTGAINGITNGTTNFGSLPQAVGAKNLLGSVQPLTQIIRSVYTTPLDGLITSVLLIVILYMMFKIIRRRWPYFVTDI